MANGYIPIKNALNAVFWAVMAGFLLGVAVVIAVEKATLPKETTPTAPVYTSDPSGLSCLIYPEDRKVVFRF